MAVRHAACAAARLSEPGEPARFSVAVARLSVSAAKAVSSLRVVAVIATSRACLSKVDDVVPVLAPVALPLGP